MTWKNKLGTFTVSSAKIMLIVYKHHNKNIFDSEPELGKEPFSHAFLGIARHSQHSKTEGTKNTAPCPLS